MRQQNNSNFEFFYQELPQSDYLDDIEVDGSDDENITDELQGLSEEQVSKIARDSLDENFPHQHYPIPEDNSQKID